MAEYKIRYPFVVKIGANVYRPGDVVELSDSQAELHVLRIEPVVEVAPTKPKAPKEAK